MATKVIASLSSALRLRMLLLLLLPPGTDFIDALKVPPGYLIKNRVNASANSKWEQIFTVNNQHMPANTI